MSGKEERSMATWSLLFSLTEDARGDDGRRTVVKLSRFCESSVSLDVWLVTDTGR